MSVCLYQSPHRHSHTTNSLVHLASPSHLRYDRHREASLATGGDVALESLARLALHLTLDLQAGTDYYDNAFAV